MTPYTINSYRNGLTTAITRHGRKVSGIEFVEDPDDGDYPLEGSVEDDPHKQRWTSGGEFVEPGFEHRFDIFEWAPEPEPEPEPEERTDNYLRKPVLK